MSAKEPQKRLGRGLAALLSQPVTVETVIPERTATSAADLDLSIASNASAGVVVASISTTLIDPNPFQPRRDWSDEALNGLAESIRRSGIMQPILVRRVGPRFQLIAGERRWRAASLVGLAAVPALVRDLQDVEAAEWALVENIQREDLNAMDRAFALKSISDRFLIGQQALAERIGLDRSTVANLMRLTELEEPVAQLVRQDKLSAGHARALLAVPAGGRRVELAKLAAEQGWSVRRVEAAARAENDTERKILEAVGGAGAGAAVTQDARFAVLRDLERRLSQQLGTKVQLRTDRAGARGAMHIEFYSLDHFDGLIKRMGLTS